MPAFDPLRTFVMQGIMQPKEREMAVFLRKSWRLMVAILIVASGIAYATAEPYQRDRVLIELGLKSR